MADGLTLAQTVVDLAREAGAIEAEATVSVAERFSTEARGSEVVKLEQSTARSVSLRVFTHGAKAVLTTSDLSLDGLRARVRETVEASRFVGADPSGGLPETVAPAPDAADLGLESDDVAARSAERKIDDALAIEAGVRAYDERIVNSSGSRAADTRYQLSLANSSGFHGSYATTTVSRMASPIAKDGENKRVAYYGAAARGYAQLESVESIAREAAKRAVDMCGARKPATMRVPVIFERDVAGAVLGDVFSALSAANVAVGNSFLADKVGERVGSDLVTVIDDGRLYGGLGTSPFDAEGVPTRETVVIQGGVLRTFLYDTYYARKLGAQSTGNSAGSGIGPNNCYLSAGELTLDELIARTPRGVIVYETIGFATESVTGTYSRGARGFAIENGELAYPIDEFTIAGNLLEMLGAIDLVGSDLRFDGSIVSPSFRIAEMTVSGD